MFKKGTFEIWNGEEWEKCPFPNKENWEALKNKKITPKEYARGKRVTNV